MIKIFIPTHGRAGLRNFTTAALLEQCDAHYTLVIQEQEAEEYNTFLDNWADNFRIAVIQNGQAIAEAREFIRRQLKPGEWCLQLDDNIEGFYAMQAKWYGLSEIPEKPTRAKWGKRFNQLLNFKDWYNRVVPSSIAMAQACGAFICAFSPFDNPFFRQKKFRHVGYTTNKAVLLRRTALQWDQSNGHPAMEEYALCAAMHLAYGRVLINNFAWPKSHHYTQGGLGPYEQRLPAKIAACADILARYPGFVRLSSKKSGVREGELRVRFTALQQVQKWQSEMQLRGENPNVYDVENPKRR